MALFCWGPSGTRAECCLQVKHRLRFNLCGALQDAGLTGAGAPEHAKAGQLRAAFSELQPERLHLQGWVGDTQAGGVVCKCLVAQ